MSQKLIEQIKEFDDFQVVRFLNHVSREIFNGIEESEEELICLISAEIKDSKELSPIFKLTADEKKNTMDAENAATCSTTMIRRNLDRRVKGI